MMVSGRGWVVRNVDNWVVREIIALTGNSISLSDLQVEADQLAGSPTEKWSNVDRLLLPDMHVMVWWGPPVCCPTIYIWLKNCRPHVGKKLLVLFHSFVYCYVAAKNQKIK